MSGEVFQFTHDNDVSGDHTWSFWVKSSALFSTKVFEFEDNGVSAHTFIAFDNISTLNYSDIANLTIDSLSSSVWNNFWIRKEGTTFTFYQNTVLKSTQIIASPTVFGGGDFVIRNVEFYDVRFFTDLKSIAALTDYYNDIIDNEGKLYQP